MRLAALMSFVILAGAGAASAQTVSVSIGPELQAKADEYGQRELDFLARDLQTSVESRLARAGVLGAGRYELQIVDATPNRPTFEQLGDRPGLSLSSFGVGGAEVIGIYAAPDGSRTPVSYRWYETDIGWARHSTTWSDAQRAFDRLGDRLARSQTYAMR
jgi:hypothetical protein